MEQETNLNLIKVSPFTRINEGWNVKDKNLLDVLRHFDSTKVYSNFNDNFNVMTADPALYQRAFLHVVTETIYHYPHNANGEKTWKPISCLRPFVLVSLPGALQDLKNLGFMTFSNWWDESYDIIQDPDDRLFAIMSIVEEICTKNTNELQEMLIDMQHILYHNYSYYNDNFLQDQIQQFEQSCINNLKPR